MKTYSFYDPSTGLFSPMWYSGPEETVGANTPPGLVPVEGRHDHTRVRMDAKTGELAPHQPPAPVDTEWSTYAWDAESWAWVPLPTDAALARDARAERDRRLAATDWVVTRAMERGEPVPAEWIACREALRDVTLQPGFPRSIIWPPIPN